MKGTTHKQKSHINHPLVSSRQILEDEFCNQLVVEHQVVWDSMWLFLDVPTWLSTNRVEVPDQYELPIISRKLEVMADVLDDNLH